MTTKKIDLQRAIYLLSEFVEDEPLAHEQNDNLYCMFCNGDGVDADHFIHDENCVYIIAKQELGK